MPTSSFDSDRYGHEENPDAWPLMPTETDIYILPDGQVVIADLPAELSELVGKLGGAGSDAVTLDGEP